MENKFIYRHLYISTILDNEVENRTYFDMNVFVNIEQSLTKFASENIYPYSYHIFRQVVSQILLYVSKIILSMNESSEKKEIIVNQRIADRIKPSEIISDREIILIEF